MAEMVGSAAVQEGVSRLVSFMLGKHEEAAAQGHMMERIEMAASKMELALERSAKLPILDVPLLKRRKMIKRVYVEAMALLDKNKQQAVPAAGQEQIAQGVKRKWSWISIAGKNLPISSSAAGLNTDDVQRFERFGVFASEFVRDLESGCSLWHNNFCNPIVRHLLEGKTLWFELKQGNQLRYASVWRGCFDEERGVEAVLTYYYEDSTIRKQKSFYLSLVLRLSASTDIVGVAIKSLQVLLTSPLNKLAAEPAMEELVRLPTLLNDIADSGLPSPDVGIIMFARSDRRDPACCGARRQQGLCSNTNVSSDELSHMFPEEVICFYVSSSCYDVAAGGRSISSSGWTSPLVVSASFTPHRSIKSRMNGCWARVWAGSVEERRDGASIQQVMSETLESDAIVSKIGWYSNHGDAWFMVEKPTIKRTSRRRYNTRGSTRRSARR